jgi:hypothetical protein
LRAILSQRDRLLIENGIAAFQPSGDRPGAMQAKSLRAGPAESGDLFPWRNEAVCG